MKIEVKYINKYGTNYIYPVCDRAKLFLTLISRARTRPLKTFSEFDIRNIKALGYEVEFVL